MLTAIILTHNSEKFIGRCIRSLNFSDEIIVIDDYSQKKLNLNNSKVKIYSRHLANDFASQRNFGLDKANGDWVLFVDSDEEVPEDLKNEILKELKNNKISGYYIPRKDFFLGKWLSHGETGNIRLIRLARKNTGNWKGEIHEIWDIEGTTGTLKNHLNHYSHENIKDFLNKINIYTDILAVKWQKEKKKMPSYEIMVYPLGKFIRNYILKLGFLDGEQGIIMAIFMSMHSFLARSKYFLLKNNAR